MGRYVVRTLEAQDFDTLMRLEEDMFGSAREGVLGPYYVRLCCDFFGDCCLLVQVDGQAVGYLLSFVKGREAYCTTLAIKPEYHGSRVILHLLKAFIRIMDPMVDSVWFTVEEGNDAARNLHAMLGAAEVEQRPDFYGKGTHRIVSRIDRADFERLRDRFTKMGLLGDKKQSRGNGEPAKAE
ncbi:MAG: GNAT family N-acetyltransferase [Myxococcota bacterium]